MLTKLCYTFLFIALDPLMADSLNSAYSSPADLEYIYYFLLLFYVHLLACLFLSVILKMFKNLQTISIVSTSVELSHKTHILILIFEKSNSKHILTFKMLLSSTITAVEQRTL